MNIIKTFLRKWLGIDALEHNFNYLDQESIKIERIVKGLEIESKLFSQTTAQEGGLKEIVCD